MRYFWKRGNSRKGCVESKDWDFSVHFVLGFQEDSIYTLHLCSKMLRVKFIQKLTLGFKNHTRNLDNFRQAVESSKSWNLMGYFFSKKYIYPKNTFPQLKHYIQRIYLTLLSTTCVKVHQTTYVIFETISHFSWHNSSVAHHGANFQTFHCSG